MTHAVIGAHYGDEGKGLVTDHLCQSPNTLVVRFNGGAQAGHTVVTPEGYRHVFHQLGAGSYRKADTLLARRFLVNPALFVTEHRKFDSPVNVFIDPRCRVMTPFDMLLNRAVEEKRGADRHGSCGLGINETVVRSHSEWGLYVDDLRRPNFLRHRLVALAREWTPRRASELSVKVPTFDVARYVERTIEDVRFFLQHATILDDADLMQGYAHLVFEGAQGLRLDARSPDFPHVTNSRTGLTNIVELLRDADWREPLNVVYVTRSYVTRHGAGPLPNELSGHPSGWNGSETNAENPWQGKLRYAPLDVQYLRGLLKSEEWPSNRGIFVTCMDQHCVELPADLPIVGASYGPTRNDVKQCARVNA